jgi:hypothetical protein
MTTLFFKDDANATKTSTGKKIFLCTLILPLTMILLMGSVCIKAAHNVNTPPIQASDNGKSTEKSIKVSNEDDDAYFSRSIPVRIMEFIR